MVYLEFIDLANTNKGGAVGFKLDAIEKCSDFKTGDN